MVRRVAVSLRGVRQTTIGTHPARCSVPVHRPDHGVTAHTVHPYCQCGPSRLRPVTRRGAPRARVGRAKASAASSADGMAARLCRRQRRRQPDGGPAAATVATAAVAMAAVATVMVATGATLQAAMAMVTADATETVAMAAGWWRWVLCGGRGDGGTRGERRRWQGEGRRRWL